jgi:hypothetical protein
MSEDITFEDGTTHNFCDVCDDCIYCGLCICEIETTDELEEA